MKCELFVEYNELKIDDKQLIKAAKDVWLKKGNKVKDIENIELYLKPDEHKCYYVITDKSGKKENDCFDV